MVIVFVKPDIPRKSRAKCHSYDVFMHTFAAKFMDKLNFKVVMSLRYDLLSIDRTLDGAKNRSFWAANPLF